MTAYKRSNPGPRAIACTHSGYGTRVQSVRYGADVGVGRR